MIKCLNDNNHSSHFNGESSNEESLNDNWILQNGSTSSHTAFIVFELLEKMGVGTLLQPQSDTSGLIFVPKDQNIPEKCLAWDVGDDTGSPFFAWQGCCRYLFAERDLALTTAFRLLTPASFRSLA
ncbi:hypothetical protein TNCV_917711 [Trichonephila clavipes]|nr:hypothetical protein TNCV_917711 [Trichonephila clavipes]